MELLLLGGVEPPVVMGGTRPYEKAFSYFAYRVSLFLAALRARLQNPRAGKAHQHRRAPALLGWQTAPMRPEGTEPTKEGFAPRVRRRSRDGVAPSAANYFDDKEAAAVGGLFYFQSCDLCLWLVAAVRFVEANAAHISMCPKTQIAMYCEDGG